MSSIAKRVRVASYKSRLNESPNFVLIGFEKTTHKQMEELRKGLRPLVKKYNNVGFNVIKNSLFSVALKQNNLDKVISPGLLKGQIAALYLSEDWVEGLSAYYRFAKKEETLVYKGGVLDGVFYGKEELEKLSQLPSKTESILMIARSLQSSQTRVVFAIAHPIRRLVNVLKQIRV